MTGKGTGASEENDPLEGLELPPVENKPWRFSEFPVLGWWAPPGTASVEDFAAYRDAGFNLHPVNPDAGFWEALEKIEAVGLRAMPFRTPQVFDLEPLEVDWEKVKERDFVAGWITHDEPGGYGPVIEAITAVNERMREDPARWALFNFLPPQAQENPSTVPIIEAAVKHGMPILSYDHYIFHKDGTTNRQWHFDNLELFRNASLEHDVPFWAFALTIQHWNYRRVSESDLRWKQFTNLAYGAKGLWYFTYWGPTDWEDWDTVAIVDPSDGSKTGLYDQVRAINETIHDVGDLLLNLRSVKVVHSDPPGGHRPFEPGKSWISNIETGDVVIGFFEDPEGARYAMVVNNRHGANQSAAETSQTVRLRFDSAIEKVTAVSWLDGRTGPVDLEDGGATLEIAGGTGVLLRAEPEGD